MYCDECKNRPASVYFTQIINGEKKEMHLCQQCAGEKSHMNVDFEAPFSIQNLLSSLIGSETSDANKSVGFPISTDEPCKNCGLTFSRFSKDGRFGCSECYGQFGDKIIHLLKRIQGNNYHSGKVPKRNEGVMHVKREIESLKEKLQKAIELEEYEKAAELRDRVRDLEKKADL